MTNTTPEAVEHHAERLRLLYGCNSTPAKMMESLSAQLEAAKATADDMEKEALAAFTKEPKE
jgi:ABC-type enterochelin transport system substrate-binding protein